MANGALNARHRRTEPLADDGIQLSRHALHHFGLRDGQADSLPQKVISLDLGGKARRA